MQHLENSHIDQVLAPYCLSVKQEVSVILIFITRGEPCRKVKCPQSTPHRHIALGGFPSQILWLQEPHT